MPQNLLMPEAEWAHFGSATVSADGGQIVVPAGAGGWPCSTWIGVRATEETR